MFFDSILTSTVVETRVVYVLEKCSVHCSNYCFSNFVSLSNLSTPFDMATVCVILCMQYCKLDLTVQIK